MSLAAARAVADAVLFEGYLLYPYRASSPKNQVRWQFGLLGPAGAGPAGAGEDCRLATEVLLVPEPGGPGRLTVLVRFLQLQVRSVEAADPAAAGGFAPVAELDAGGARWIGWDEAVEREVEVARDLAGLVGGETVEVSVPGGCDVELLERDGLVAGRLLRRREPLRGALHLKAAPAPELPELYRVRAELENLTPWGAADLPSPPAGGRAAAREVAARASFIGTHLLLAATGGSFVSLTDPPPRAAAAAAACRNHRCWPVLVGQGPGEVVLASPIILGDHPAVAPESAGDLFDCTEIDEILTLRVMTLTEEEKRAARGTDPRAGQIIDRCDRMTAAELGALHGARRAVPDPAGGPPEGAPWWDPGVDGAVAPERDSVTVGGVQVARGSRVRLRPGRRADAQDMFLAGRTAKVAAVYADVDGGSHVALLLEDDAAAELHEWYGRYYYFAPDELEPLGPLAEPGRVGVP